MAKVTRKKIDEFLSAKSIAVIGASRNKKEYSRSLFQELLKHGYDAIPVNPNADKLDGEKCHKNIKGIKPAPQRALILLPENMTEQAVLDCAEAGGRDIWLHRHVGPAACRTRGRFSGRRKRG